MSAVKFHNQFYNQYPGFRNNGRASPQAIHSIVFATKQNTEELEHVVNSIADPHHPNYGHYLAAEEVNDMVTSEFSNQIVLDFLSSSELVDVERISKWGNHITVTGSIATLEILLSTEFF